MKTRWYKDAVFYQIYPRSYYDSDGDGLGDIRGIIEKIDYLKRLGITAVWLSPVYASPCDDNGYDISDYNAIMPEFGTMEDWQEMTDKLHANGIKLIMDLVVNHTSDQHRWFLESRSSKSNPYRDYYIWRKGNGKKPPNNWTSRFTGSAWEYDENTDEYYLHLFSKKQPDLNWDNPKVREEVANICNFWLEKGVDGFRCDVISYISKEEGLPNSKMRNPFMRGDDRFVLGPNFAKYLKELGDKSWNRFDTFVIGEGPGINFKTAQSILNEKDALLDSIISFEHVSCDLKFGILPTKFRLKNLKSVFSKWQSLPRGMWNSLYLENHDQPRVIPRFCSHPAYAAEGAKMLAVALHMQKGTPFVYQGEEIAMTNCKFLDEEFNDKMSVNILNAIKKRVPFLLPYARKKLEKQSRDNARTPMQWSNDKNAGFTAGTPWLKVNPNYKEINVADQEKDPNSVLNFYRKLIAFRKEHTDLLREGEYRELLAKHKRIFAYTRSYNGETLLVLCNFSSKIQKIKLPEYKKESSPILSNYAQHKTGALQPYEASVYLCK